MCDGAFDRDVILSRLAAIYEGIFIDNAKKDGALALIITIESMENDTFEKERDNILSLVCSLEKEK